MATDRGAELPTAAGLGHVSASPAHPQTLPLPPPQALDVHPGGDAHHRPPPLFQFLVLGDFCPRIGVEGTSSSGRAPYRCDICRRCQQKEWRKPAHLAAGIGWGLSRSPLLLGSPNSSHWACPGAKDAPSSAQAVAIRAQLSEAGNDAWSPRRSPKAGSVCCARTLCRQAGWVAVPKSRQHGAVLWAGCHRVRRCVHRCVHRCDRMSWAPWSHGHLSARDTVIPWPGTREPKGTLIPCPGTHHPRSIMILWAP